MGKVFFFCCFSLLLLWSATGYASDSRDTQVKLLNQIVAVIDGEPLTYYEYLKYRRELNAVGEGSGAAVQDGLDPKLVAEFVRDRLLELEAKRLKVAVASEEIDEYLGRVATENGVSQQQFIELLIQKGISLESWRKYVQRQILRSRLVSKYVNSKLVIVDSDIEKYLEKTPEQKPKAGDLRLYQVIVRVDETGGMSLRQARADVELMRRRVAQGEEIKFVSGGSLNDMGYVNPSQMRDEFQQAVSGLEVGQLSQTLEMRDAVLFFYVASKVTEDGMDELFKEDIKRRLFEQAYEEGAQEYFLKELPKNHEVEMK